MNSIPSHSAYFWSWIPASSSSLLFYWVFFFFFHFFFSFLYTEKCILIFKPCNISFNLLILYCLWLLCFCTDWKPQSTNVFLAIAFRDVALAQWFAKLFRRPLCKHYFSTKTQKINDYPDTNWKYIPWLHLLLLKPLCQS